MKSLRRSLRKRVQFLIFLGLFLIFYLFLKWNNDPVAVSKSFIYIEPIKSYFRYNHDFKVKDWHDYEAIAKDANRSGPGEQGVGVKLTAEQEKSAEEVMNLMGHNGYVSDLIARDRAIPDSRPKQCSDLEYLADLPKVSVVIPFYNEVLSTLTRTVHSVINRSPPELIHEVILVNDHSDQEYLYKPLEEYIEKHFDTSIVKILVLPQRSGLMWARQAGARYASSDVLVFMDCHMEANVNWLPPLLDPIAKNFRTCTTPLIDGVSKKDYMYEYRTGGNYQRGVFDWQFNNKFVPMRPGGQDEETGNYEDPAMMGCIFAISAKFFWELGGYDSGLSIWGGEQYELSFKIWLCGGKLIGVPCSKAGHLYRSRTFAKFKGEDYITRNLKRVCEVWINDYSKYIYERDPPRWDIDHGDVSEMLNLKKKLQCKSFDYFLDYVAPDMLDRFPLIEPPPFALGSIQNVANPDLCITKSYLRPIVANCKNRTHPPNGQKFRLRQHRDIYIENSNNECLDISEQSIIIFDCKFIQENQYFRYELDSKQIICGLKSKNECMSLELETKNIIVTACDANNTLQQWNWSFVNETMLRNWTHYGKPILDETEYSDLTI